MSITSRLFPSGDMFHVYNKSIANYKIFRTARLLNKFIVTINYYNNSESKISLSRALRTGLTLDDILHRKSNNIVYIIAYCIMPDHYHLLIKINNQFQFSKYINNIESSYTRFYNKFCKRKGPLWQSRFKASHVSDNSTLLHVNRYIHLNPTTAQLVDNPQDWKWSSYPSYINSKIILEQNKEISIRSIEVYKTFTENQIDYQRTIRGVKRLLLE